MSIKPIPNSTRAVVFFIKKPQRGLVKTRIAEAIGEEKALALYHLFLQNLDRVIDRFTQGDIWFAVTPEDAFAVVRPLFSTAAAIRCLPQEGATLGERMKNTFQKLFALGYQDVVLAGSDIPELKSGHLAKAFAVLKSEQAVLGPCLDGGYYLIGFSAGAFDSRVFDHVPWSSPSVLKITRQNLSRLKISFQELPVLRDIDLVADLKAFVKSGSSAEQLTHYQKILET